MMNKLKAKLKNQGGFTMVELLIVVAIIAILVAVSIPMMNTALERARHAVDQANVRDAIGLASVEYVSDPDSFSAGTAVTYTYYVDKNSQGYLVKGGEAAPAGDTAVTPDCTCTGVPTSGLIVEVTPPAAGEKKPTIKTSWRYDAANKKTIEGDYVAP
ncbi:type II secretion system protein [uncultured Oscillibacter sp.]|uniref:type II secretion system protein n=1 Tax=uncultured Oscillibacter sp. TaxID=876091 RepID=UPI00261505F5|nr:prepilin-type N-terminal cleavage/methylation domain-containing protein [uncultured Oscillibacter sp.]